MRFHIYRASGAFDRFEIRRYVVSIGSAPGCALQIADDPAIASRHVDLVPGVAHVVLRDVLAPVLLAGRPLAPEDRVPYGEVIQVGATRIELQSVYRRHLPVTWSPNSQHYRRTRLSDDPVEHELLATLRARPTDEATRAVYADYLLDHGRDASADAVRGLSLGAALLGESTVDWRAIALRAPIAACERHACPRSWHALQAVPDDRTRRCEVCAQTVHYCATVDDACSAQARGDDGYVIDPQLEHAAPYVDQVEAALIRARTDPWRLERREVAPHPAYDARWVLSMPDNIFERGFTFLLGGATLHLLFGGNDAGSIDVYGPPRHDTSGLRLTGLDQSAIVAWVRHNIATLPPTQWGYT